MRRLKMIHKVHVTLNTNNSNVKFYIKVSKRLTGSLSFDLSVHPSVDTSVKILYQSFWWIIFSLSLNLSVRLSVDTLVKILYQSFLWIISHQLLNRFISFLMLHTVPTICWCVWKKKCQMSGRQCRPRSDAAFFRIWTGSTLFHSYR